ncbi:MAG: DUF2141 domain-containing protein [Erythrobacter sp.]
MTALLPPTSFSDVARRMVRATALTAVLAGLVAAPLTAQAYVYAQRASNDLGQCAAGKGPAVRIAVNGLKSADGNLFVRAYPPSKNDWLKSKRYLIRIEARPQAGSTTVCVPLPAVGDYAIAVTHDVNGNRKTDISTDGGGMSNNPEVKRFLGLVPRPPSVDKVRFTAGPGVTRMTIAMQYW